MGVEVVVSGGSVEAVDPAKARELSAKVEAAPPAKELSVAKVEAVAVAVAVAVAPGAAAVAKNTSFREESNRLGDLRDGERKALGELRAKVEEAIMEGRLFDEDSSRGKAKAKVGAAKEKVDVKKEKDGKKKKTKKAEPAKEEAKKEEEVKVEAATDQKKEEDASSSSGKVKAAKEKVEGKKKKEKKKDKAPVATEEKKAEDLKLEVTVATVEKKTEEQEATKEVPAPAEEKKTEEGLAAPAEEKKAEEAKEEAAATSEEKKGETDAEEKEEEEAAATSEDEKTDTAAAAVVVADKDVTLWGVPLLPSKGDEATDVVLLKFLRARDFRAGAAFEMLRRTLRWRREWRSLGATVAAADDGAFMMPEGACRLDGADREGHPVCYSALGVLADDAVYRAALGDDEAKARFLRWRVRAMESHVAELDFRPGGVASLLQVTDLRNSPGPSRKDFRVAVRQVVDLFQDNYPELVARNILINVPLSYYAFSTLFYPFLTQRTRSKFVIARPSKVTETLLKCIPIESIPVKYGGLKRDGDTEFCGEDAEITEVVVKASSTGTIEIEATEGDTTLTWDLTVLGWEVSYKEEFVPSDEGSYTIVVSKGRKVGAGEEAVRNSFRAGEPGKVVITVENATRGKKKVVFRHKAKCSSGKKC